MAKYSAVKATVNAYIKQNGRKEITGRILNAVLNATIDSLGKYFQFAGGALPTDDPGTPDQNVCYLAGEPGVYTNFGGITIENEEVALLFWDGEWTKQRVLLGIQEVEASVDNQVGTPSVDVSYSGGQLVLTFHNLKGEQGIQGDAAGFGTIGADINEGVGTPGVSVDTSGDNTAKNLMFHFTNLKGETGVTSVVATIDDTSGTPSCQVSLVNGVLTLAFSGLKGIKGDTGVSADYPITIYNGLDSDATDQALAAAQGKILDGKISQLLNDVVSWAANTQYVVGDVRKYNGVIYLCKTNHTSTTTFLPPYWDKVGLYKFITDNSNDIIKLNTLNGNASYQQASVSVAQAGKYRNTSGAINTLASASISAPIPMTAGQAIFFESKSNLATFSALSLVTSNGEYIKTLFLGNAGKIQYIALDNCYVEICDLNGTFTQGRIYIIGNAIQNLLPSLAKDEDVVVLQNEIVTNKDLLRKSTMLEHLSNPFVKTRIHLFGDSITQGQGSSDYSPTGEAIPNYPSIHRNVGTKSYAALFASQLTGMYNRKVWASISTDEHFIKGQGIITNEGDFATNNANGTIYVQFEFFGTEFSVINLGYVYGGIYKIVVDDVDVASVDTYDNANYIITDIANLSNGTHIVKFVGTATKSHSSSVNVLRFSSVGITKVVEVVDDGIVGHQSTATNGVVSTNATTDDDFIIWMSGTNDRVNGYWETEKAVAGLMHIIENKHLTAEVILMAASPCGKGEFTNPIYISHMQDINAAICKMARKYNLCFISHYEFLTRYCREHGGSISLICSDGVHPNDLGHMLIYQNMCKELNLSANSNF